MIRKCLRWKILGLKKFRSEKNILSDFFCLNKFWVWKVWTKINLVWNILSRNFVSLKFVGSETFLGLKEISENCWVLTGRWYQMKMTLHENNLTWRQPHRKSASEENSLGGRQPQGQTTLSGRHSHRRITRKEEGWRSLWLM